MVFSLRSNTLSGSWPFDKVLAKIVSRISLGAQVCRYCLSRDGLLELVICPNIVSRLISLDDGPGWEVIVVLGQ